MLPGSQCLATTASFTVAMVLSFQEYCIVGNMDNVAFSVALVVFLCAFSVFFHCSVIQLLFIELNSLLFSGLTQSYTEWHLGCFQFLAAINNSAIKNLCAFFFYRNKFSLNLNKGCNCSIILKKHVQFCKKLQDYLSKWLRMLCVYEQWDVFHLVLSVFYVWAILIDMYWSSYYFESSV